MEILKILETRFEKNMFRHENISWAAIEKILVCDTEKIKILEKMEDTGGEPDVLDGKIIDNDGMFFCDFSLQTPSGRTGVCYDKKARENRKKFAPDFSALELAHQMGIQLLDESQYRKIQQIENLDTKTSSWLLTPENIRKKGGAIFGDSRYGETFVYHNGADSYYSSRGFRGILKIIKS